MNLTDFNRIRVIVGVLFLIALAFILYKSKEGRTLIIVWLIWTLIVLLIKSNSHSKESSSNDYVTISATN